MYIFISHSSVNAEIAEKVCNLLEENGHGCFLAPRDIRTGHEYAEEIIAGIERSDVVLLLLSKEANESPHVLREIERAVSKHITIMVYKLEEVKLSKSLEYFLMMHQWVNAKAGVDFGEILAAVDELAGIGGKEKHVSGNGVEDAPAIASLDRKGSKPHSGKRLGILCSIVTVVVLLGLWGGMRVQRPVEVVPGDTILFGSYNGETIEWRVLEVAENGKEAVVIAEDILCMKAFDAAESGRYNHSGEKDYWGEDISGESRELQRLLRGDNRWSTSNIRTWLNSPAENVVYEDQAPVAKAMSSLMNGYDGEVGFLNGFSKEERNAILMSELETNGIVTQDKVFLLSVEELAWLTEADVKVYAIPTEAACGQDKTDWYENYALELGVEDFNWWLRDGSGTDGCKVYLVGNSYAQGKIFCENAGLEGYGIRPALKLDLTSKCIVVLQE